MLNLLFDDSYFNDGTIGYKNYTDYPHFLKRAEFIRDILKAENVIVLGGSYGFLTKHLLGFNIKSTTIDNSDYAYKRRVIFDENYIKDDIINLQKYTVFTDADWIVSWNVLDCVSGDDESNKIAEVLNNFKGRQLHVICMSDKSYEDNGYFIQPEEYWKKLFPSACLVNYDIKKIIQKPTGYESIKYVPLSWEGVSE